MRALLVVNPKATATTKRGRDVLVHAVSSDLKVEVVETQRRGHAAALGRDAVAEGLELVVTLGGDGTVNEVVNGLLSEGPGGHVPALAVVPGGSTNVFARALGLPRDPVEATGQILEALRAGRRRTIGLGQADERYFTFCAGMGIDGEVVRRVEAKRRRGKRSTNGLYVRTTVRSIYGSVDRRHPPLTLHVDGEPDVEGLQLGFVQNTAPWTYLGSRAVDPCPDASFETGLDVYALRSLSTLTALRQARQLLTANGRAPRGRSVVARHDLQSLSLTSEHPMPFQVDGDYLGERTAVAFRSVPRALEVIV
jgi:diacylglycerol kinase family enzyme